MATPTDEKTRREVYGTKPLRSRPRPGVDGQYNDPFRGATTDYIEYSQSTNTPTQALAEIEAAKPYHKTDAYKHAKWAAARNAPPPMSQWKQDLQEREAKMNVPDKFFTKEKGYVNNPNYGQQVNSAVESVRARADAMNQAHYNARQLGEMGAAGLAGADRDSIAKRQQVDRLAERQSRRELAQQGLANSGYAYGSDLNYDIADRETNLQANRDVIAERASDLQYGRDLSNTVDEFGQPRTEWALDEGRNIAAAPELGGSKAADLKARADANLQADIDSTIADTLGQLNAEERANLPPDIARTAMDTIKKAIAADPNNQPDVQGLVKNVVNTMIARSMGGQLTDMAGQNIVEPSGVMRVEPKERGTVRKYLESGMNKGLDWIDQYDFLDAIPATRYPAFNTVVSTGEGDNRRYSYLEDGPDYEELRKYLNPY